MAPHTSTTTIRHLSPADLPHRAADHDFLEIVALSPRDWRICDSRISEADASRILGYVERVDSGFDVLWMTQPLRSDIHPSFDAALRALAAAAQTRRVA